jgi:hypothetical protein
MLGTVALLGSGVAIAMMVMPELEDETPAPAPRAGAPAEGPATATPALTKKQRRARHDAVAILTEQGYEPVKVSQWLPGAPLKVLVGETDSGAMRAFFFSGAKFIGHDDPATSTNLRVAKIGRSSVTLAYKLNAGGTEKVRFELQDGDVVATGGTIPAASVR